MQIARAASVFVARASFFENCMSATFIDEITVAKPPQKTVETPKPAATPAPVETPKPAATPAPAVTPTEVPIGDEKDNETTNGVSGENQNPPPADEPRKRGRPAGSRNAPKPPNIFGALDQFDPKTVAVSEMTFDLCTGSLTMFFGPEWQPRSPEERAMVVAALATYYKEKGEIDIPPKLALVLICAAYAGPRFAVPNTRNKIRLLVTWLKFKISWFLGLFKKRP
ncbi:MAG TPA: hypothetical protein VII99_11335 [Bacteroidia bacterium]